VVVGYWSPHGDAYKRQIPTGLMWGVGDGCMGRTTRGGWGGLPRSTPAHKRCSILRRRAPLGGYDDYPELYTRWFSTPPSCPSSALTAAATLTRSGPTASSRADPGKVSAPSLQLMPYILFARLSELADRRRRTCVRCRWFSQRSRGRRLRERVYVRAGLPWWLR